MNRKSIAVIIGTTGAGKSKLAVTLAKHLNGEVINTDAVQAYRGYPITTNQHPLAQREQIPHHLLDICEPGQQYTVWEFLRDARRLINEICERGRLPILVGGTHYYLQCLLWPSLTSPNEETSPILPRGEVSDEQRQVWWNRLQEIDPVMAAKWHPNDYRRILKSLSLYESTGKLPSELLSASSKSVGCEYRTCVFWVYSDREVLKARLRERAMQMLVEGMFQEARRFHQLNPLPDYSRGVGQAIGFQELAPFCHLEPQDFIQNEEMVNEAIAILTQTNWKYVRQQLTWIRRKFLPSLSSDERNSWFIFNSTEVERFLEKVEIPAQIALSEFLSLRITDNDPFKYYPEARALHSDIVDNEESDFEGGKREQEDCKEKIQVGSLFVYTCRYCREGKWRGDKEWRQHVYSRKHQRIKKKMLRKPKIMTDLKDIST